jgi:hypothetical protein
MKQLRTLPRLLTSILAVLLLLLSSRCGDDENPSPTLPTGCSQQGTNAIAVLNTALACQPTNAFADATEAIGPPNASQPGSGKNDFQGFVSLGINGGVTLYLGSCIQDLPGADLRVYQAVSSEAVEVQVSQSQDGPFVSLGMKDCGDRGATFSNFCDFDLAGSGLNNVRVIRVFDREVFTFPGVACDNAGSSPGADLDAVEVLHAGS